LKQIGLGMTQYSQDYDEKFLVQNQTAGLNFAYILQPYLKSKQIFVCPSALTSSPLDPAVGYASDSKDHSWQSKVAISQDILGSYGMNSLLENTSLSQIQSTATTAMFFDAAGPAAGSMVEPLLVDAKRHFEGYNFCFADGHVKYLVKSRAAVDPNLFP
jgi:prepilin-type processing-associated H-X9-DG protein